MRIPESNAGSQQDGLLCRQLFEDLGEVSICKVRRRHDFRAVLDGIREDGVVYQFCKKKNSLLGKYLTL